ncbi:MAG: VWA domain-containing protein [Planctomycetes bacterium]|nr:VWA domain-containing protein [Planctomycetota bacterium]
MTSITLLSADELVRAFPPQDEAGFGTLKTAQGNLPLKLLDINARVTGLVAETRVRQTFVNTSKVPLEATYIFPLPGRAAVSRFRFEIGERVIEGELQERGEARRVYQEAISQGHRAAITEEERPGVFTMRVGNLMPGDEVTVHLTLSGALALVEGEATYRFPLVVAPRYIPGSALPGASVGAGVSLDTNAVPDASRISPPVLLPGFPNPVQLGISVEIDETLPLRSLRSSLHAVLLEQDGPRKCIRIQPGERLNRDFVLRFGLASAEIQSQAQTHFEEGQEEGTFQLVLVPPHLDGRQAPRDVAFVIDRSGSMGGWKMVAARRACARLLDGLSDQDRFSVLAFDSTVERPPTLPQGMIEATDRNRFRAIEYLSGVEARGGTEMAGPIDAALTDLLQGEAPNRDRVLILITDGQVGNEDQLIRTHGARLGQVRCFTLGIDRAVNEAFLERLAEVGRGACEVVETEDRLDEVMDGIQRRIGTPVLTGLRLEGADGLEIVPGSVTPERMPDLFAGMPIRIQGRCRGQGSLRLRAAPAEGGAWISKVEAVAVDNAALTRVWARARVRTLEDRYAIEGGDLAREIVALSLRHSVLCRFTSFVAVDRSTVVNEGGEVHKVTQAVEQPEGWDAAATSAFGAMAPQAKLSERSQRGRMSRMSSPSGFAPPPPPSSAPMSPAPMSPAPMSPAPMSPAPMSPQAFGGGGDPFSAPDSPGDSPFGAADPFAAAASFGAGGGGDAFAASTTAFEDDGFSSEGDELGSGSFDTEDLFDSPDLGLAEPFESESFNAPKGAAPADPFVEERSSKREAIGPDLRQELESLKARFEAGSLDWQATLREVRRLLDRMQRAGADEALLFELRALREVLTQGLVGGHPADAASLTKKALTALAACLGKLPVGRGESFWF